MSVIHLHRFLISVTARYMARTLVLDVRVRVAARLFFLFGSAGSSQQDKVSNIRKDKWAGRYQIHSCNANAHCSRARGGHV
jgi:hypothetical protein